MAFEKMKILVVSTTGFKMDGITNVIMNYYRAMDKSDMQIDFVVPNEIPENIEAELNLNNSRIFQVKGRMKRPLKYYKKLRNLIRQNQYDIVHAHGNSRTLILEMYAAKNAGTKIRIPHSHNTTSKFKVLHKILKIPFDAAYTHGFSCGIKAGEWLYNQRKFQIINNGINTNSYKYNSEVREKFREKYDLNSYTVIGHVGAFTFQKNHEYLINIFSELLKLNKDYKLLLIGNGELKVGIEKKLKDSKFMKSVVFIEKTSEVSNYMQAMDIMVMPSRFEGLPLTLVEAQASGLPCLVSNKVSEEARITGLVNFLPIDVNPKIWANEINAMNLTSREHFYKSEDFLKVDHEYGIDKNAFKMKALYTKYLSQKEGIE